MSITDDGHKLDRILESTNLDVQSMDCQFSNQVTGRTIIPASELSRLTPHEGSSMALRAGVDPCQGSDLFCLSSCPRVRTSLRSQECSSNLEGGGLHDIIHSLRILLPVILLIASYFPIRNSRSKESCIQNPTHGSCFNRVYTTQR